MSRSLFSAILVGLMVILLAGHTAAALKANQDGLSKPVWSKTLANISLPSNTGILAFPKVIVVIGANDIYGLDAATGAIKYGPVAPGSYLPETVPAVVPDECIPGGAILLQDKTRDAYGHTSLIVFDLNTGTITSRFSSLDFPSRPAVTGLPQCTASFIVAGPKLMTVVPSSGISVNGQGVSIGGLGGAPMNAITTDGSIFAGAAIGNIHSNISAVNVQTGKQEWVSSVSSSDAATVLATDGSNDMFVAGDGASYSNTPGVLAVVEGMTGKTKWESLIEGSEFAPPVAVGSIAVCTAYTPDATSAFDEIQCADRQVGASNFNNVIPANGVVTNLAASKTHLFAAVSPGEFEGQQVQFSTIYLDPTTNNFQTLATASYATTYAMYNLQQSAAVFVPSQNFVLSGMYDSAKRTYVIEAYNAPQ